MNEDELVMAMHQNLSELESTTNAFAGAVRQPWDATLVSSLSYSVLGFTLTVLVLCTVLLWRKSSNATDVLKVFGIVSIVGMSALLLITGYDKDQLTPIVGLFGAISGYLLGRDVQHSKSDQSPA